MVVCFWYNKGWQLIFNAQIFFKIISKYFLVCIYNCKNYACQVFRSVRRSILPATSNSFIE